MWTAATRRRPGTTSRSTTYEMFQEKCLGEACRPIAYPLNLALGTSQKFNFSSAKLDHINYRQGLSVERSQCDSDVSDRIFGPWFEEADRVPKLLPKKPAPFQIPPHEWHWPGFPTLDAQVDTQADINQINAGTLTWREFWAKRGYDWKDVMAQQAQEKAEVERLGLTFGEPMKKTERLDETTEAANAA
jgi:capsid protein